MADAPSTWDGEQVRRWLDRRVQSSRLDQAAADRQGYEARDDHDRAAAEEWVCETLGASGCTDDKAGLARCIRGLIAREEYRVTGIHDDERFGRHVRTALRKVARMAKANDKFGNMSRYQ